MTLFAGAGPGDITGFCQSRGEEQRKSSTVLHSLLSCCCPGDGTLSVRLSAQAADDGSGAKKKALGVSAESGSEMTPCRMNPSWGGVTVASSESSRRRLSVDPIGVMARAMPVSRRHWAPTDTPGRAVILSRQPTQEPGSAPGVEKTRHQGVPGARSEGTALDAGSRAVGADKEPGRDDEV